MEMANVQRKVFIVDDQKLFVEGLKQIICSFKNVEVIGQIYRGDEILSNLLIHRADIVFLDLNLPGKNGLEVLAELKNLNPNQVIVILSMYADLTLAKKCKALGANAYLTKDADIEELRKVIFYLDENVFYLSKHIKKEEETVNIKADKFDKLALITSREREIIAMIVKGFSNQQIGDKLFISPATVQTHRKNIFNKLKINKVQELVVFAFENGIE